MDDGAPLAPDAGAMPGTVREVFAAFLILGLTSFGGPLAHLGYFRRRFVGRWLDEAAFAEIVALCAFLPGPTSSQAGVAIGRCRAGWAGAAAAWVGFTLPSALLMAGFALAAASLHGPLIAAAIHGLKLAAVAIVAQAVIGMARTLTPDWRRRGVAVFAAAIVAFGGGAGQLGAIVWGALAGVTLLPRDIEPVALAPDPGAGRTTRAAVAAFVVLLGGLPLLHLATGDHLAAVADAFFRAGALVFGGGHVVLPLLRAAVVPDWIGGDAFLAGYGAAQALPGPLFAFAAYLGMLTGGVAGAVVALAAIFLPGMLLLVAVLPLWTRLRVRPGIAAAVGGINAAVVGLLAATLVSPVATSAITGWADVAVAGTALAALLRRAPPLAVVAGCVAVLLAVA